LVKGVRSSSLLLIFLLIVTVALLLLYQGGYLRPVEAVLIRLISPLEAAASSFASRVGGLARDAGDLRALQARHEALEAQANNLLIENIRLKEVEAENESLRRLLGFAQANPDLELKATTVRGQVIGREPSNLVRYLIIDIGERDGVRRNMPVVTEEGLVGTVDQVYATASKVRLINDLNSSVNVILQRSRVKGVARGMVDGNLLMEWIPQDPDAVAVGDIVLTSGLGGRFPRLLIVGQVVEAHQRDYEMFRSAVVRPVVDFQRLDFVLVVTGFTPLVGLGDILSPRVSPGDDSGGAGR